MVVRLVARALAGRDHLEAGGARPVDMLADQRRLIAPGERIDDAGLLRLAGEQRTRERVRLHIDHHDVLAVRDRLKRMADAGARNAGRLDDHLDLADARSAHRHRSVTSVPRCLSASSSERARVLLRRPAGGLELLLRARHVEIGDADNLHPVGSRACDRNIVPNLPAPISPTVTGPARGLALKQLACRFTRRSSIMFAER